MKMIIIFAQGCDLSGFFLISGFFVTKISAILSIFSPILCVLAQFYAIFQDFFITFWIFPEKLITPLFAKKCNLILRGTVTCHNALWEDLDIFSEMLSQCVVIHFVDVRRSLIVTLRELS